MEKYSKLALQRAIFMIVIIVIFGVILITEKGGIIFSPKATNEINEYLETNYMNVINNIDKEEVNYNDLKYTMKIKSKENENLYFYITYSKNKITDTYKTDYIEGKSLFNKIEKDLKEQIKIKTNQETNITIIDTLDNFTSKTKERIIKEDNLLELKFYTIENTIEINNWNEKEINSQITNILTKYKNTKINPKYINFIIQNNNDTTKSLQINNLTLEYLNNIYKEQIINDIIKDKETEILKTNNITFNYNN